MYFSNIGDAELQYFHKTIGADFSMSLTQILSSNLFKVETIVTDSLYRVYPLFYCGEIISSNTNDKILDNRCLILMKQEHETYLSFMTDENKSNSVLRREALNTYGIGDSLSIDEFNALVYTLRSKSTLSGAINFKEDVTITGIYGEYQFNNVDGRLRNDNGLIVNNDIKNNLVTVKLVNPFFINAKYVLNFTVRSLTGVNVCDGDSEDYITEDTFNVELIEGVEIPLPLSDYVNDSIVDFDVSVAISFDVPEIINGDYELTLNIPSEAYYNDSVTVMAKLSSSSHEIAGHTVTFKSEGNTTVTAVTNNNGECSVTMTVKDGVFNITTLGLSATKSLTVKPVTPVLTGNFSPTRLNYGETVTVTGNISLPNSVLNLLVDNSTIATVTANASGNYNYTFTALNTGTHNLAVEYIGSGYYTDATVNQSVVVNKLDTNLTLTVETDSYVGSQAVLTGVLTANGNRIANAIVSLYDGDDSITDTRTNSAGEYEFIENNITLGQHDYHVEYHQTSNYNYSESPVRSIEVVKRPIEVVIDNYSKSGSSSIKYIIDGHIESNDETVLMTYYWIKFEFYYPWGERSINVYNLNSLDLNMENSDDFAKCIITVPETDNYLGTTYELVF